MTKRFALPMFYYFICGNRFCRASCFRILFPTICVRHTYTLTHVACCFECISHFAICGVRTLVLTTRRNDFYALILCEGSIYIFTRDYLFLLGTNCIHRTTTQKALTALQQQQTALSTNFSFSQKNKKYYTNNTTDNTKITKRYIILYFVRDDSAGTFRTWSGMFFADSKSHTI